MSVGLAIAGMAAGQVIQGVMAKRRAGREAALLDQEAQYRMEEAQQARLRAALRVEQMRREARRRQGQRRANMATSGLTISGSFLDVLADAAMEEEQAALLTQFEGAAIAQQAERQASLTRIEAKNRRAAGRGALISSIIGAGTTILGGYRSGAFGKQQPSSFQYGSYADWRRHY